MGIFLGLFCLVLAGCQREPIALTTKVPAPSLPTTRWEKPFSSVGKLFGDLTFLPARETTPAKDAAKDTTPAKDAVKDTTPVMPVKNHSKPSKAIGQ